MPWAKNPWVPKPKANPSHWRRARVLSSQTETLTQSAGMPVDEKKG